MARHVIVETEQLSDSFYYIMISLVKPRHGYLIMQFVEEISGGEFKVGPATLYTVLKKLLEAELIELESEGSRKKVYQLTPKGKNVVIQEIARREKMVLLGKHELEEY